MLNIVIFILLFSSLIYSLICGKTEELSSSALDSCVNAIELFLQLAGSMALWGGIMRIAQKSGLIEKINRVAGFVLRPLFKGLNPDGEAMSCSSMNVTANLLGIGNASTPLGIKALKEISKEEGTSSVSRSMAFLILLNTSSIQLIPMTVCTIRRKYGAEVPFDCTLPILFNSVIALVFGCLGVYILFGRRKRK